mgnify:CR=1 FL=1
MHFRASQYWIALAGLALCILVIILVVVGVLYSDHLRRYRTLTEASWTGVVAQVTGAKDPCLLVKTDKNEFISLPRTILSQCLNKASVGDSITFVRENNSAMIKPKGYGYWIRCKKYDDD